MKKKVIKIKVDGCLGDDSMKRCDFLFEIGDSRPWVIYLELKGCDIERAYEQLCSTIAYCGEKHNNITKRCYIVASRVPKIGPKIQGLKEKIAKRYKAQLSILTKAEVSI